MRWDAVSLTVAELRQGGYRTWNQSLSRKRLINFSFYLLPFSPRKILPSLKKPFSVPKSWYAPRSPLRNRTSINFPSPDLQVIIAGDTLPPSISTRRHLDTLSSSNGQWLLHVIVRARHMEIASIFNKEIRWCSNPLPHQQTKASLICVSF